MHPFSVWRTSARGVSRLPPSRPLVGVLEGTGIGPPVIAATLAVLKSVEQVLDFKCEIRHGGLIGEEAIKEHGQWLPEDAVEFCADVFQRGGAILNGPGGGRYVYDLRRRFDLFCKIYSRPPGGRTVMRRQNSSPASCGAWTCSLCVITPGAFIRANGVTAPPRRGASPNIHSAIATPKFIGLSKLPRGRAAASRRGELPMRHYQRRRRANDLGPLARRWIRASPALRY